MQRKNNNTESLFFVVSCRQRVSASNKLNRQHLPDKMIKMRTPFFSFSLLFMSVESVVCDMCMFNRHERCKESDDDENKNNNRESNRVCFFLFISVHCCASFFFSSWFIGNENVQQMVEFIADIRQSIYLIHFFPWFYSFD